LRDLTDEQVHDRCKRIMDLFDALPLWMRRAINEGTEIPQDKRTFELMEFYYEHYK